MIGTHVSKELAEKYTRTGEWSGQLIDEYVSEAATAYPDNIVFVDRTRGITFAEFNDLVNQIANAMIDVGIRKGEVVSWQLPNWIEAAAIHLATIRIGAVSNPIIPIYRDREVEFILRQAKTKLFFVPAVYRKYDYRTLAARLSTQIPTLEKVVVVGESDEDLTFADFIASSPTNPPSIPRSANDIALLLYTSGTVADPKGVLHSHNTLTYENRSIIDLMDLNVSDRIFMPSPVAHITGILYGIQLPFMLGNLCVFQDQWNAKEAVKLIDEYALTFATGATPFLHELVRETEGRAPDELSLEKYACGGADVPPSLVLKAVKTLGAFVTRVYGSSEFPTALSSGLGDPEEKWAYTDGRRIARAEIRLVKNNGDLASAGEEGEIEVRGAELFQGYLDDALNQDAFTPDGWFRTGDLGIEDKEGFISITGRKKDIILRGGENISAKEIEDVLFTHRHVSDVAVVGMPDPVLVERICAYVVPTLDAEITLDDLTRLLKERGFATQKFPEKLIVTDELPRTASGKVKKHILRERIKAQVPVK